MNGKAIIFYGSKTKQENPNDEIELEMNFVTVNDGKSETNKEMDLIFTELNALYQQFPYYRRLIIDSVTYDIVQHNFLIKREIVKPVHVIQQYMDSKLSPTGQKEN